MRPKVAATCHPGMGTERASRRAVGLVAALALASCWAGPPQAPGRELDPPPDGPVVEPARGTTGGTDWAFGVYRSGIDACFYTVSDELVQGPGCGPINDEGSFGPLGSGGDLVEGWTYVGGIVSARVASVHVVLQVGARLEVPAQPIDPVGFDAGAFFTPLEPGFEAVRLVAVDARGLDLEHVDLIVPGGPGPALEPTPSG